MTAFIFLYLGLGVVAGMLAGLLGLGGGIVIVPMLHFAFQLQQIPFEFAHKLALGTSLACIVFTSISSSRAHHKRGGVEWPTVFSIAPGILLGTFCGSFLAAWISARYLQMVFIIFLFYVAYSMLTNRKPKPSRHLPGKIGLSAAGLGIGGFSSLVGIGGGTLSVPYLLWHNVEMRRAVGTSAAIGFPIAVSGCAGYLFNGWNVSGLPEYSLGFIYLPAMIPILCMSTLFAPLGAKWAHMIPVPLLKKCFAVLLIVVAIKMGASTLAAF